ncbi:S-adenosylmethionine:tRNA ribosyltransferase-isomerase [Flavobacteriales bacterium]|nr:S-adenosylmethionine:tRNA ribosyltransferase-isomerase [Flavobacteriales bacterium]
MNNKPSHAHPSALAITDYTYQLPDARIAKYPLTERDTSKLLVYKDGDISQKVFKDLSALLHPNDCLVFNDTRVIHARIHFQRQTGALIEVMCLEPVEPAEVSEAFIQKKSTVWRAMVGNGKRWKMGELLTRNITTETATYQLHVELQEREPDAYIVRFSWDADFTFAEVLDDAGILPLPPYLNRDTEQEDEERYQTVYAQADGSVAAPTAGLHFTQSVFNDLKEQQVQSVFVTLHVGAGTFKPVKSDTMQDHEMHKERILVSVNAIEKMRGAAENNRIIAVGTTSLRTIESIYWFGVKLLAQYEMKEFFVGQWEPYELADKTVEVSAVLNAVLEWMLKNGKSYLNGYTQVLIAPGYQIRMANALITNFHQPQSTLLLLVAALIGPDWKRVYNYALENNFRFLSFGDSSILFKNS